MDLNLSSRNAEFSRGLCQMLVNKNVGMSGSAQQAQAAIFMGSFPDWLQVDDSPDHPAAIRFDTNDTTIFIILGARTPAQVTNLCDGYLTKPNERNPDGFNPYARSAASALMNALTSGHAGPRNRLIIAGHSTGGIVGMAMAAAYAQSGVQRTVSISTFGAPMAGDGRVGQIMRGVDIYRWMARGDHVPFMPPSIQQAPAIGRLFGPLYGQVQPEYRQFGLGGELDTDGTLVSTMYPTGQYVYTDLSLAAFALTNDAPIAIAHSIQTYLDRIDLYFRSLPIDWPKQNAVNGQQQPNPSGQPNPQAGPPPAAPGAPPPELVSDRPPLPPNPPLPYHHAKANGQNVVMYGETIVAVCKSRKAARDLARALNTAYRRWWATRIGDGPALAASVAASFPS